MDEDVTANILRRAKPDDTPNLFSLMKATAAQGE